MDTLQALYWASVALQVGLWVWPRRRALSEKLTEIFETPCN